jgi:hypothetical protein
MTRTDVMASSRPRTAGSAQVGSGVARISRRVVILPVLLLMALALVLPSVAMAASEPTSGYGQTPTTPAPTPTTGTSPSKEEKSTPASKEEPAKAAAPSTGSEKASTLPFTGLDLRWMVAVGLLLMGAGFSIVVVQRRSGSR